MKRLFPILLAALMIAAFMNVTTAEEQKTLTYWSLFSGGESDVMQALVDAWNATDPEYKVDHTPLPANEYYAKLQTAVSTGEGPDIGISHVAKLAELVDMGVVYPMTATAQRVGFDFSTLNQAIMQGCIVDDEIYAMPIDTHTQVLFYNADLLEGFLNEDGKPEVPQDAAEFLAYMLKVKATLGENEVALAINDIKADPFRMWWSLYYQAGGAPIITSDCEITLDKDIMEETLSYMKTWYTSGAAPRNMTNSSGKFASGEAAFTFQGVWKTYVFEKTEGLNFGTVLYPQLFGNGVHPYTVWGDSHTMIIPSNKDLSEERLDAIMRFMRFVSENSITWATAGHIVANTAVVQSEEYKALPYRADFASAADSVIFFEPNPYSYPLRDIMYTAIASYLTDAADFETAYADMIEEIEALIY